jgi:hypothetical protein
VNDGGISSLSLQLQAVYGTGVDAGQGQQLNSKVGLFLNRGFFA